MLIALLVILGLGTITFGILTVIFSNKAATVEKFANQEKAAAVAKARDNQKQLDNLDFTRINESPFRAYTAPVQFGSFVVSFPKNWSSSVREQPQGTQVSLALNPDFLRNTNGQDEITAVRVMLMLTSQAQYMEQFKSNLKSGTLKQVSTKVSGQTAFEFNGKFNGRKTIREVVVPIRDKVLVFSTESSKYTLEFNTILSQAKIIP
jgi:hypothetical protein